TNKRWGRLGSATGANILTHPRTDVSKEGTGAQPNESPRAADTGLEGSPGLSPASAFAGIDAEARPRLAEKRIYGPSDAVDHEGVRSGWSEPPHHLQLDFRGQGRIRPHRGRRDSHLRRLAVA